MAERKKLSIIEVKEIQTGNRKDGSTWQKLSFKAKDEAGNEYWYQSFRNTLFSAIQENLNKTIGAEVDVKETEQGTNRNVTQVFIDGNPVAQKQGGYRGKSPEEIQSIERQCAIKSAIELCGPGAYLQDVLIAAGVIFQWIHGNLPVTKESSEKPVATTSTSQEATKPPASSQSQADKEFEGLKSESRSEQIAGIETGWLEESMQKIHWRDITAITWLVTNIKGCKRGKTLAETLTPLTPADKEKFTNYIQSLVDVSGK